MELIFLRHGKAEPHGHPAGDAARALVPKGFEQARKAALLLKASNRLPQIVLTSPLTRALQTAETFCTTAGLSGPVVQGWLASGMQQEEALQELAAFSDFKKVAIVGHEPDFSALIEWLLGGGAIEMKKGGIASLLVDPPLRRATLCYLVPPALMPLDS
jgi:phosphohistidine phosphatase